MSAFIYNNKTINKVLIVGYGITGKSIYNYLQNFNIEIDISENAEDFVIKKLSNYDLIAVSPGIPLNKQPYSVLQVLENITSDIDLFYNHIKDKNINIVAVTGSNGKSTIVTMLDYVLTELGQKSILVGNIGTPILSRVDDEFEYCIVELSSFQIDLLKIAKFDVACIINISQDHLDRYKDYQEYIQSKFNLEKFTQDFFVYDFDQKGTKYSANLHIKDSTIYDRDSKILSLTDTNLSGSYNLDNIVVVMSILTKFDFKLVSVADKVKSFQGLKHRCNNLGKIDGITYINDSKGTNVGATQAAIESLANGRNIVLLLGGVAKGGDFTVMSESLTKYVKFVSVYGRDADYIIQQLPKSIEFVKSQKMLDAVQQAEKVAVSGDLILLSPACASFDEFSGFVYRGNEFEKIFNNIKSKKIKTKE